MGQRINGDLIPIQSGIASLGVDSRGDGIQGNTAFDTLAPFNHVHQVSGVFHDPLHGQSGVLRFNQNLPAFEVSYDGGLTFQSLAAGAGIDNIGVLGGTDLTGTVDLASAAASGFIAIFDTGGASPIQFAVDQLGLSGLWDFPEQGFNGKLVNCLTDFNGTTAQGEINVVGASGIVVDIVGQTMTITPGSTLPRCYAETVASAASWTITHNLGTEDVAWTILDDGTPRNEIGADSCEVTDANTLTIGWNVAQAGRVIVFAC